ncbi:MAG: hypothetical protein RL235_246, partial [Chlamydiota bacterium]
YFFDPALAADPRYLVPVILIVFWGMTFVNMLGVHVSARINDVCAVVGTLFPMVLLMLFGVMWVAQGNPVHLDWSASSLFPTFENSDHWVSLVAIVASFLGMELAGVHAADVHAPQKNFPRALAVSVIILIATQLFGALAIAAVVPGPDIRLVDGVMQTFAYFCDTCRVGYVTPFIPILILLGSVAGLINWLVSPAKGLFQAAQAGFLPRYLVQLNRNKAPARILIIQAVLVSLFCFAFIVMPSVNAFYWFLMALSTSLYVIMYIMMFLAAHRLGRPHAIPGAYMMPRWLRSSAMVAGVSGCVTTIVVGMLPPQGVDVGGSVRYMIYIAGGMCVMISPVALILWKKRKERR